MKIFNFRGTYHLCIFEASSAASHICCLSCLVEMSSMDVLLPSVMVSHEKILKRALGSHPVPYKVGNSLYRSAVPFPMFVFDFRLEWTDVRLKMLGLLMRRDCEGMTATWVGSGKSMRRGGDGPFDFTRGLGLRLMIGRAILHDT